MPERPARAARAAALWLASIAGAGATASDAPAPGEYLFRIAGCAACHTAEDGAFLAGGRALASPFGTFRSPNITPDRDHGLGGWSAEDLVRALRDGEGPGGIHYYPVFPYPSYAGMRAEDARAIFAYLQGVEAVARANEPHDLPWWLRWRFANRVWKWLFLEPPAVSDPDRSAQWNRGAYLVNAVAHCPECHTPRTSFGALDRDRHLAGEPNGPEGEAVPNITSHREDGIGTWSERDVATYLRFGLLPDGDVAGGAMAEVIEEGLEHLTKEDARAIAAYLASVPPLPSP